MRRTILLYKTVDTLLKFFKNEADTLLVQFERQLIHYSLRGLPEPEAIV